MRDKFYTHSTISEILASAFVHGRDENGLDWSDIVKYKFDL